MGSTSRGGGPGVRGAGGGAVPYVRMTSGLFFHKGVTRLHSEELLLQAGEDGSFLVRDSESVTGAYVLCLLHQRRVHQYRILPDKDGRISVQSEGDMQPPSYGDLPSLINSYIHKGEKNGLVCPLKRPVGPEGVEVAEADSEDEDFDESKQASGEDKGGAAKTFKFGLLNNFARLDLSSCDGEFVDAMKQYIDQGLEKDLNQGASHTSQSSYPMPEFQKLLAVAGKGLQREMDLFLLKLSMCQDMLSQEEDDRRRTLTSNPMDRLGSYIDFIAAKLETCRTQILALEKKAHEVLAESSDTVDQDEYTYPDISDLPMASQARPSLPPVIRRHSSINIPLSTFEVKVLKYSKVHHKLKLTVDIHQGRLFAVKPSKDALDASNTFPHHRILQLVKNTTDNSRLHVIFDNKKKYTYQFENALARESFCLQIRQMKSIHSQEQDVDNISVFIGTWNMGKSAPVETLRFWLKCSGEGRSRDRTLSRLPHDLYVIGTQESAMTEKDWINTLKAALKAALNIDVDLLESCSLWGIRTLVFINPKHRNKISHIQKSSVRTGIANALGNKGGSAISFLLSGTSFCFINAHLASGDERCERRNANFRDILKNLSMGPKNLECYDITHKFHHVFFFGDLNYRITEPVELVLRKLDRHDFISLLEQDQLKRCQFEKKAFFGFSESEILFMPTYRLERHSSGYKYDWKKVKATSERINVPSWCDRILWHSFPGTFIESTAYGSVENLLNSDHRPVFGSFTVGIASPFIQNRASLQDNCNVKLIFKSIEAQIKTSTKQFYILEFSSSCLPDIICCESNKKFGDSHRVGFTNNPVWGTEQLPQLRPLFGDVDFLEDQHLLVAVKGSGEDHESYGECILPLKDMCGGEPCYFETVMTHHGEETGRLKGEWHISISGGFSSRSSRKTYDIVTLDTEYRDPEEFLSLSPPVDPNQTCSPFPTPPNSAQATSSSSHQPSFHSVMVPPPSDTPAAMVEDEDPGPIPSHYVNHQVAKRMPSDPVPDRPTEGAEPVLEAPPPIPVKRGKPPLMGQTCLVQGGVSKETGWSPEVGGAFAFSPPASAAATSSSVFRPVGGRADKERPSQHQDSDSKVKVMPTAPPMPEQEIYPSIAIRPYEELKKPATVQEWLMGLGLSEYTSLFLRHGWDSISALGSLNASAIMKMGIRNGEHHMRLLNSGYMFSFIERKVPNGS